MRNDRHQTPAIEAPDDDRWVARLWSTPGHPIEAVLHSSLGLDVWQRSEECLVVAASASQLAEIERRRLARVERLSTVSDYTKHAKERAGLDAGKGGSSDESDP